jgi:isocitrate/isopropylmalate dehydrogenase
MKSYNIAVIPGDGTGPEVVREGAIEGRSNVMRRSSTSATRRS